MPPQAPKEVARARIEACALVTAAEVAEIQGSEVTDTKSSENADDKLLVSQCYYSAAESSKSVSFALTQNGSRAVKNEVGNFWKRNFGQLKDGNAGEKEREGEAGEENEQGHPPQKIGNLGEEAYWAVNRFGGALYVLKKDLILRISVGGPGAPEAKLARSRALAAKALSRL
ncbi:MAG: hypothetical protein ACR2HH_08365 [Chthoniobacterales bacterium]